MESRDTGKGSSLQSALSSMADGPEETWQGRRGNRKGSQFTPGCSVHPWVTPSVPGTMPGCCLLAQRKGWDPGSAPRPHLWNPTLLEAEKRGLVTLPHGDLGK